MVLLERLAVGISERDVEFFTGVLDIFAEGFFGEFESTSSSNSNSELVLGNAIETRRRNGRLDEPVKPEEASACIALAFCELVVAEVLEGVGFFWVGSLAVADFLLL